MNTDIVQKNIYTYRRLRRAIGYLGLLLPIVLIVLSTIPYFNTTIQTSISDYYYTNLRDIFTGTLSAVGFFMIRYKGNGNRVFWKNDNLLTNLAGMMAIGVALFPTAPDANAIKTDTLIPWDTELLKNLHFVFAALLFIIFSLLSTQVFTLGTSKVSSFKSSIWFENNIYRFCGYGIIVCIILISVCMIYFKKEFPRSTLIFETIALFLFGIAWLIKGRALGDKGMLGRILYGEENDFNTEN